MSRNATVGLVFGRVGSGAPCSVNPCQIRMPATVAAARQRMTARIVEWRCGTTFTRANYHTATPAAGALLRFFSGFLLRFPGPALQRNADQDAAGPTGTKSQS